MYSTVQGTERRQDLSHFLIKAECVDRKQRHCTLQTIFLLCIHKKRFSQVSPLITIKHFQNRIMFCQNYDILQRSTVLLYMHIMQHNSAVIIGNNIFPNGVMKFKVVQQYIVAVLSEAFETISHTAFIFWNILKVIFCSRKARISSEQGFGKDFQYQEVFSQKQA